VTPAPIPLSPRARHAARRSNPISLLRPRRAERSQIPPLTSCRAERSHFPSVPPGPTARIVITSAPVPSPSPSIAPIEANSRRSHPLAPNEANPPARRSRRADQTQSHRREPSHPRGSTSSEQSSRREPPLRPRRPGDDLLLRRGERDQRRGDRFVHLRQRGPAHRRVGFERGDLHLRLERQPDDDGVHHRLGQRVDSVAGIHLYL
jgi:hypothetical protein